MVKIITFAIALATTFLPAISEARACHDGGHYCGWSLWDIGE
jgi:hypothetical protein